MRQLHFKQEDDTLPTHLNNSKILVESPDYNYFTFGNTFLSNCEIIPHRTINTLYLTNVITDTLVINLGRLRKIYISDIIADNIIIKCNTEYRLKEIEIIGSKVGTISIELNEPLDEISTRSLDIKLPGNISTGKSNFIVGHLKIINKSLKLKALNINYVSRSILNTKETYDGILIDKLSIYHCNVYLDRINFIRLNKIGLFNRCTFGTGNFQLPDLIFNLSKGNDYPDEIKAKALIELDSVNYQDKTPSKVKEVFFNNPLNTFQGVHTLIDSIIYKYPFLIDFSEIENLYPYIDIVKPEDFNLELTLEIIDNPLINFREELETYLKALNILSKSDIPFIVASLVGLSGGSFNKIGYSNHLYKLGVLITQTSNSIFIYRLSKELSRKEESSIPVKYFSRERDIFLKNP